MPLEDPGYLETQTLLASYEAELAEIRIHQQEETESKQAYELAQQMIANLPKTVDRYNRDRTAKDIIIIINRLEKVKPETTVYQASLDIKNFAQQKLQQLQS